MRDKRLSKERGFTTQSFYFAKKSDDDDLLVSLEVKRVQKLTVLFCSFSHLYVNKLVDWTVSKR